MSEQRKALLKKLLDTYHLNNIQRNELNPCEVYFKEILEHIEEVLEKSSVYPESSVIWSEGDVVDERCIIRKHQSRIEVNLQRASPINNKTLAEKRVITFNKTRDAIKEFCRLEFPEGKIDGIKIVY